MRTRIELTFILWLLTMIVIQSTSQSYKQTNQQQPHLQALNFSILNKGESVKIPLQGYFPFSQTYSVYDHQSSANIQSILNITFSQYKIQNQTSQHMIGNIIIGRNITNQTIDLSEYKIMDVKTIYNQPNKLFLLENNLIMMYSYREKSLDKVWLDDKARIIDQIMQRERIQYTKRNNDGEIVNDYPKITVYNISLELNITGVKNMVVNCFQMESLPLQAGYKLIVLCKMTGTSPPLTRNYIVTFNMEQSNHGFITNLIYNSSNYIENDKFTQQKVDAINKQQQSLQINSDYIQLSNAIQSCQQYHVKYFNQLVIVQKQYSQTVIVYCNSTSDSTSIKQLYQIAFYNQTVIINKIISNTSTIMNITTCLINSRYLTQFQNGFISIKSQFSLKYTLRIYKYQHKLTANGKYQTSCTLFRPVNIFNYTFITSRNQSGVQTIYVIFTDKIMIFQSYSPNYQTLMINVENFTLVSYAVSSEVLSLHFEDRPRKKLIIKAYDIKSMYPHKIDQVQYDQGIETGVYLFPVMNYLQKGNYFFIYQRQTNMLNLTYYSGQYVNITITDPDRAIGLQRLAIINSTKTNLYPLPPNIALLPVNLRIRTFCDTSIQIVPFSQIKLNSKLFNIDLVKAIIGPLGRFYKIPNDVSSLQFVNSFHEIDITDILGRFKNKKLITFSIDDFLNFPIMTFYFEDFLFLKCDLQFDYYQMKPLITRCFEVVDTQTTSVKPLQIIIYEQDKFIHHNGRRIYFCRIQSSRDTTCIEGDFQQTQIKKIKLIKYTLLDENYEFISVFIIFDHCLKQKDYRIKSNPTSKEDIKIGVNVVITENQIQHLKSMTIRTVQYDEGYENFLLLYMIDYFNPVNQSYKQQIHEGGNDQQQLNQTYFHVIQIYAKPQLQPNQSSTFIGHLIEEFVSTELDNVFIIDNKILQLSIKPQGSTIQQYRILDFKCIKIRNYPLYDHIITKNGSHAINSGFLFVQVQQLQQQLTKYLVYNPKMNTTNIVTHSFQKINDQKLMFIQKMTPSENVMAIHGNKLITLSLPNIVVKLSESKNIYDLSFGDVNNGNSQHYYSSPQFKTTQQRQQQSSLISNPQDLSLSDSVSVSFIDNNDVLKLLQFQYSYDVSDSKIQYSHQIQQQIQFKSLNDYFQLEINASEILGPVSEYNIANLTALKTNTVTEDNKDICQFIQFNSSDIFTKTKCIKYFNSKQDGIMQDFLTYETGLFQDITIIVTDKKILCIENMIIQNKTIKSKTKDCNMFQEDSRIFIICTQNNSTTMNMLKMTKKCQFTLEQLQKPDFLKYNLFNMLYSRGQAVFQLPIRSQTNMIYYLTKFDLQTGIFDQNSTLLKHESEQWFNTKDFELNDGLMFMLENGLGIYNLSKRNESTSRLMPDDWIDKSVLMEKFGLEEEMEYVNCLEFDNETMVIVLQIGTTFHSFETHLFYELTQNSFTTTSIKIISIEVNYIYKNPWSCYNTLLSKSRYYKNMTIKMCSFQPQQHYIFSNFIPINDNKQNSYIIFYQKNFHTNESYPFRMDIIYTNIYSNDNFQIPKNKAKLLIGSLFNLLCEYDLRSQYLFNFTVNPKIEEYINDQKILVDKVLEKQCWFRLNLSNQNYQTFSDFSIKLDFEKQSKDYWTDWKYWIQRVFFILVIANFIRLEYIKRAERNRLTKNKVKRSRAGSFDQEFDIQVRFNSKKVL